MSGIAQLIGFFVFILPSIAWNWLIGNVKCPRCRGLKKQNGPEPNKLIACQLCSGTGWTKP